MVNRHRTFDGSGTSEGHAAKLHAAGFATVVTRNDCGFYGARIEIDSRAEEPDSPPGGHVLALRDGFPRCGARGAGTVPTPPARGRFPITTPAAYSGRQT